MSVFRTMCLVGLWLAAPPSADAACLAPGATRVQVIDVDARLELRLADGRRVRLVGVDPAMDTPRDPDLGERTRAALAAHLAGASIDVFARSLLPDRWGRIPADAASADESAEGGLAAAIIAQGAGRYLAEPAAHACRDALLAAERTARADKLGLWRDPYYAVLAVDDREEFAERSGTIVVVEGELAAVQSGPYRTTMRFAASGRKSVGGRMLVATIAPRTMKQFRKAGFDPAAMIGQRLRVRGLLDLRFGPQITIDDRDEIEVVTGASVAAPAH